MIKKIKISNAEVQELLSGTSSIFPKYTTQIMNLANQNAQGTRPRIVGQMSDLIQEFDGATLYEWKKWYLSKYPNAIQEATDKVYEMVCYFKEAINDIDKKMVREWIEELVVIKTFSGLKFQEALLKKLSIHYNKSYRLANPSEESLGIDGYIGKTPISVKPITYKSKLGLNETIDVPIVYYDKRKSEVVIEFEENIISL